METTYKNNIYNTYATELTRFMSEAFNKPIASEHNSK